MLRSFFIALSKATWAQRLITRWKFAWSVASRFIAGETSEEAICAVERLNQAGILATLDHLGENTSSLQEAEQATLDVLEILERIEKNGVQSNVSIKLSQLGLTIDEEQCRKNLLRIFEKASQSGNFIRIDMEDASLTDKTLEILEWAHASGYPRVGIVIQSYLYRSQTDVRKLLQSTTKIRLVKGAYKESAQVAYPAKKDVDENFDRLLDDMLDAVVRLGEPYSTGDGRIPPIPAVATHDIHRIDYARKALENRGLPKDA
ncbi:MAG: proline dehydrogenase family protein, partial [Longilinea sp.]|nr:proline dehydrogenase family protein [Longilinea sp.]